MSARLSGPLIEQMLQGLTPQPWGHVQLHTGTPPGDPSWACARPVRFEHAWTAEIGDWPLAVVTDVSMPPGVMEVWDGSRPLGTPLGFREPGDPLTWEAGGILGRIDAALEDWERGEDAARWQPEG